MCSAIIKFLFSISGPVIFGPFDATTPYSIPWPTSQTPFHAPLGPFGPYGPYPLGEATPVRNAGNETTAMAAEATNQTLSTSTTIADVNESLIPTIESRLIAEGLNETVPIDIEEEENEDEDYEDVADEQDDEDENDVNDEDDDGEEEVERASNVPLFYDRTQNMIVEGPFSNQPTAEAAAAAAANALPDPAFDAVPELPDGVDPSFLAALPQEMREEVLAEHIR